MEPMLWYLAKANLILVALFAAYYLLAREERAFQLNRVVLWSMVGLSLILPLLPAKMPTAAYLPALEELRTQVLEQPIVEESVESEVVLATPSEQPKRMLHNISLAKVFVGIYWLGVCFFLWRTSRGIFQTLRLIWLSPKTKWNGYTLVHHLKEITPFSFFRFIVYNKQELSAPLQAQVLVHETVHAQQWHSLDVLISELVRAFFWVNPIAWKWQRQLKLQLEYFVDDAVLKTGVDRKSYQYSILQLGTSQQTQLLANLFNTSPIKNRIRMMNTKQSPDFRLLKYLLFLPLIGLSYAFVQPSSISFPPVQAMADKEFEGVYVAITPDLREDLLLEIVEELRTMDIYFDIKNKQYSDEKLMSIDLGIRVPGLLDTQIQRSTTDGNFEPIYFYYETSKKGKIGVTTELPTDISRKGKRILRKQLSMGLYILWKGGGGRIIGAAVIEDDF
ncbi:MAG: M56 family metallopeptidase [Bacteroidota bacterium]